MSSWDPGLSASQSERLDLLIEECSEVIKAACKIKRFGYYSTNGGSHPPNIDQLIEELGDVSAIVTLLEAAGDVQMDTILTARDSKLQRMRPYVRFQDHIFGKIDREYE